MKVSPWLILACILSAISFTTLSSEVREKRDGNNRSDHGHNDRGNHGSKKSGGSSRNNAGSGHNHNAHGLSSSHTHSHRSSGTHESRDRKPQPNHPKNIGSIRGRPKPPPRPTGPRHPAIIRTKPRNPPRPKHPAIIRTKPRNPRRPIVRPPVIHVHGPRPGPVRPPVIHVHGPRPRPVRPPVIHVNSRRPVFPPPIYVNSGIGRGYPPPRLPNLGPVSGTDYYDYGYNSRSSLTEARELLEVAGACGNQLGGPTEPMSRLYNPTIRDHMYTILPDRTERALQQGWRFENILADFAVDQFDPQCRCLKKFYALKKVAAQDHFYTIHDEDVQNALRNGYVMDESPNYEGFCVPYPNACGATVPVHRFYSEAAKDHFYTTETVDKVHATSTLDYRDEGIECYAWEPYNDRGFDGPGFFPNKK